MCGVTFFISFSSVFFLYEIELLFWFKSGLLEKPGGSYNHKNKTFPISFDRPSKNKPKEEYFYKHYINSALNSIGKKLKLYISFYLVILTSKYVKKEFYPFFQYFVILLISNQIWELNIDKNITNCY